MLALSLQGGELLLQATQSQDLEEAFHKVYKNISVLDLPRLRLILALWEKSGGVVLPSFERRPIAFFES